MLRLYDTKALGVLDIAPVRPRELSLYCCGPELSRPAHLGDLRTALLGDLIHRVADLDALHVTMVRNVHDDADEARRHEAAFHRDLAALGVRPAHTSGRTSDCVGLVLDLVARLVESGHAYRDGDGSVLFDARGFPGYGALSGHRLDAVRPGAGPGGTVVTGRRFDADWVLWQRVGDSSRGTQDSPWGPGVPGRHVACSAMAMNVPGETVDVQAGGIEQLFPHHEDQRAQSDAAAGHEVVRHWVHSEQLIFEGRVMDPTGDVVLLEDVQARGYDPLALRLAFLRTRYRARADLGWDVLTAQDRQLAKWRYQVATWAEEPSRPVPPAVAARLLRSLLDDLDTPRALQDLRRVELDSGVAPGAKFETFAYVDRVLGLDLVRQVGRPADPAAPKDPAPPQG